MIHFLWRTACSFINSILNAILSFYWLAQKRGFSHSLKERCYPKSEHVNVAVPKPFCFTHCKDKIPKFRNKYSKKRNIGVSVLISTFMHLWVIYILPRSVCLFRWRKYVDQSWDYINSTQTHECGNLGWGRAIPIKGIHKWDFRCSAWDNGKCRTRTVWVRIRKNGIVIIV